MDVTAKPKPRVTPDNRPFWEGCREHVLKLPWCSECGRAFLPPAPVCPRCFGERIEWRAASGRGTVTTFVVVHQPWFPAFADDLPYNAAQVELEEGPRLTTSLVGIADEDIVVGLEVEAEFDDLDGETTLPRFRPRGPGGPRGSSGHAG